MSYNNQNINQTYSISNNSSITYEDYILSESENENNIDSENDSETETENEYKERYSDTEDSENESEIEIKENLKSNIDESDSENDIDSDNEIKNDEKKDENVVNKDNKKKETKKKCEMEDCGICTDKYNRSNRKEIKCLFCNYSACKSCYEQFLLQSNDSVCMNCKAIWNREFLDKNFTKVFLKGKYKIRREDILMDRQKALLQSTLPIAEIRMEAKKRYSVIKPRRNEILNQIDTLNKELREIDHEMYGIRNKLNTRKIIETEKRNFIKKCPNSECRGFLSTRWKCGLCNTTVCSECHEIKNEENNVNIENNQNLHVCKPENVETAKLIAKDCKNCPKCGTYIYKIDGCMQMFCMNCHTAFDWKTGLIETGRIHNPHYYEWMRKNGKQNRELMDIPCGGVPTVYNFKIGVEPYIDYCYETNGFYTSHQTQQLISKTYIPSLYSTLRFITHIQDIELRDFQYKIETLRESELELRCRYLMNEITEDIWKTILQQNEYKLEYLNDVSQLYQMISTVGSEIILYIYNTTVNNRPRKTHYSLIIEKMTEINELVEYFNEQSFLISKRFGKKRYDYLHNFSIEKRKI